MATTPIVPLLLLLSLSSTLAVTKFWNIDCGADEGFTNPAPVNLTWLADGQYVRAGESHKVENTTGLTTLATLRAFPKDKKNCYTIPVGEGVKVLATLRFYYGNYDGLRTPPTFQLIFDSTLWREVETSMNIVSFASVIYVTKKNETSICFGRLYDNQDPFVSSIEVRILEAGSYGNLNSSFALTPLRAVSFGSNESFRYPDDPYDRPWNPDSDLFEGFNYTILANNVSTIDTSTSVDSPPERIFRNAAVPLSGDGNLSIRTPYLISIPVPIFLNMYFSEVSENASRSFMVYGNGEPIHNNSVVPLYGKSLELSMVLSATSNTTITLVPTPKSTLPPLINGMEVLFIRVLERDSTSSDDVDALAVLQDKFQILQNWTGDPCLPKTYNWEWVNCSSQESTRVTKLSLGGYGLSGSLPNFSGLDALEIIDLHNNSLTGDIPAFLARLPNLKELNLAYNNFSSLPSSLGSNSRIKVNITGNPLLEKKESPAPVASPNDSQSPPPRGNGCSKVSSSSFHLSLLSVLVLSII